LLAEQGHAVGRVAQMRYPGGRLIAARDNEAAVRETLAALREHSITLFEAASRSGVLFARHDILVKNGDSFDLIEVKSSALDRRDAAAYPLLTKAGGVRARWRQILSDIAFQRLVLSRAHPGAQIRCFLLCPDADATAPRDGLPGLFRSDGQGGLEFTGDAADADALADLLTLEPVDEALAALEAEVTLRADQLATLIRADGTVAKAPVKIGYHCKNCEFRTAGSEPDGFRECWGALADPKPHLFDLFQLYSLKNGQVADELIARGTVSLGDVSEDLLSGPFAERQRIQIRHQLAGTEWISDSLGALLTALPRPLHFIDFETCTPVLPEFAGMRPNEIVAFQWSCHTVDANRLHHREWLHDPAAEPGYPNLAFARTLLAAVDGGGTVLTWTGHEAGVLRQTARAIRQRIPAESALADRVEALANRLVDQCEVCRQHYFHPAMGGSNSLKAVLPAIWNAAPELRSHPWFAEYSREEAGCPVDPYKTLPPLPVGGEDEVVREGTGAIRAYHALLHGSPGEAQPWRELLSQYCRLDTLAMVIVWEHWKNATGSR
jgi:hypothetical protein